MEKAARDAGVNVQVPFTPGRMDATQEQTDAESFKPLEPVADGFRNYYPAAKIADGAGGGADRPRAITDPHRPGNGGAGRRLARAGGHANGSKHGVFTDRPGKLTNDFFVNLLDMATEWEATGENHYAGRDRKTKQPRWTATRVDLIFGSHSELRALAEVYGCADAHEKFVRDFVAAWNKVMMADRYDLGRHI